MGKGAEVKDLVPALLSVWLQLMDNGTESHRLVKDMLEGQCLIQDILSKNKEEMFLPIPDAQLLAKTISEVLIKYSLLANIADKGKLLLWNSTPPVTNCSTWDTNKVPQSQEWLHLPG